MKVTKNTTRNKENYVIFPVFSTSFVNAVYPEKFGVFFVVKKAFRTRSRWCDLCYCPIIVNIVYHPVQKTKRPQR